MAKMRDKMDKLRKETEEQGINISEDALFIVSELRGEIRETRNILLIFLSVIIGLIVGFGVATLTAVP